MLLAQKSARNKQQSVWEGQELVILKATKGRMAEISLAHSRFIQCLFLPGFPVGSCVIPAWKLPPQSFLWLCEGPRLCFKNSYSSWELYSPFSSLCLGNASSFPSFLQVVDNGQPCFFKPTHLWQVQPILTSCTPLPLTHHAAARKAKHSEMPGGPTLATFWGPLKRQRLLGGGESWQLIKINFSQGIAQGTFAQAIRFW